MENPVLQAETVTHIPYEELTTPFEILQISDNCITLGFDSK
jgi:hypothetical protein